MNLFDKIMQAKQSNQEKMPNKWDVTEYSPQLRELIKADNWDKAYEMAKDITSHFRMYTIAFNKPIDDDIISFLLKVCNENRIEIRFFYGANETKDMSNVDGVTLAGCDWQSSKNIVDLLNKMCKEGSLPKNRKDTFVTLCSTFAQEDVFNRFCNKKKLFEKFEDDSRGIVHKIFSELGFKEEDNPFITFLSLWNDKPLSEDALVALNNAYANYTIDEEELKGLDPNKILFNQDLYKYSSSEILEMINDCKKGE